MHPAINLCVNGYAACVSYVCSKFSDVIRIFLPYPSNESILSFTQFKWEWQMLSYTNYGSLLFICKAFGVVASVWIWWSYNYMRLCLCVCVSVPFLFIELFHAYINPKPIGLNDGTLLAENNNALRMYVDNDIRTR